MTVKILEPAIGRRGACIAAIDGRLCVVDDPTPICHGYQSGCRCEACKERADLQQRCDHSLFVLPQDCECERPIGAAGGDCAKCGKPRPLPAAA